MRTECSTSTPEGESGLEFTRLISRAPCRADLGPAAQTLADRVNPFRVAQEGIQLKASWIRHLLPHHPLSLPRLFRRCSPRPRVLTFLHNPPRAAPSPNSAHGQNRHILCIWSVLRLLYIFHVLNGMRIVQVFRLIRAGQQLVFVSVVHVHIVSHP